MHTISKEQIEFAIDAINTGDTAAARMLQGLLAQPECEPVAYVQFASSGNIRLWSKEPDDRVVTPPIVPLYTHPAPFVPITADMVTDEMVAIYCHSGLSSRSDNSEMIAAAVNAWGAKK